MLFFLETVNRHAFLNILERFVSVLPAKTCQYEYDEYDSDASENDLPEMQVSFSEHVSAIINSI